MKMYKILNVDIPISSAIASSSEDALKKYFEFRHIYDKKNYKAKEL